MSLTKRLVRASVIAVAAVCMYEGALSLESSREVNITLTNLSYTTEKGVSKEKPSSSETEISSEKGTDSSETDSEIPDTDPADSESSSETESENEADTNEQTETDTGEQTEISVTESEDDQASYKAELNTEGLEIGRLPLKYYKYSDKEEDSMIYFPYFLIPSFQELRQDLNDMIDQYEGSWSIYVKDLKTSISMTINDRPQDSASLIKLYIAGAVLESIQAGELEETETIDQLLSDMITLSDNEASNELVRYLSEDHNHRDGLIKVNEFIQKHGYDDTYQYNGLEDSNLWYSDEVNITSVKDCGRFLEEVYDGALISHLSSRKLEGYLLDQTITWKIPAGIPSEIKTANKTGEKDHTQNDVSLVYTPYRDYILCVMATDIIDENTTIENIRAVSGKVYEYLGKSDSQLEIAVDAAITEQIETEDAEALTEITEIAETDIEDTTDEETTAEDTEGASDGETAEEDTEDTNVTESDTDDTDTIDAKETSDEASESVKSDTETE